MEELELSKKVMTAVQSIVNKKRSFAPKVGYYEYTPYDDRGKIYIEGNYEIDLINVNGLYTHVYSCSENKHYTFDEFNKKHFNYS
mgnify:CR=1 FL=1|jgi:hypothetical protein